MFFILLYRHGIIFLAVAVLAYLMLFLALPDILELIPKPILKIICFAPAGLLLAFMLKLLIGGEMDVGLFLIMLMGLGLSGYWGYTAIEFL